MHIKINVVSFSYGIGAFQSSVLALSPGMIKSVLKAFKCEFFMVSGPAAHDLFHAVMGRTLSMTQVSSLAPGLLDPVSSPHQHCSEVTALGH